MKDSCQTCRVLIIAGLMIATSCGMGGCQSTSSNRRVDLMVLTDQVRPSVLAAAKAAPAAAVIATKAIGSEVGDAIAGNAAAPAAASMTPPAVAAPATQSTSPRTIMATLPLNIRLAWVERDDGAGQQYGSGGNDSLYDRWSTQYESQRASRSPQYVTVRSTPELETLLADASTRLTKLAEVAGAAPVRGLELSKPMEGDSILRAAAARAKGDLLIVATGQWRTKSDSIPLTQFFSLGLLPSRWETSEATAEAILLDVKGGEVLYRWSVAADATQLCNSWTADAAAKDAVARAQTRLMDGLLVTLEKRWPDVIEAIKAGQVGTELSKPVQAAAAN